MSTIINGTTGVTYPDGVTQGSGTPTASATSGAPLVSNGTIFTQTTPVGAAFGGTGLTAAGTSGNVLTSNGTTWVSSVPAAFDAGTVLLFYQAAAPTGWTKLTTQNDKALRVVSGTGGVAGGTTAFSTVFANQTVSTSISVSGTTGSTTLTTAQIPSHTHPLTLPSNGCGGPAAPRWVSVNDGGPNVTATPDNTGGGGSHNHSFSGSGSGTSSAVTLNVQYIDIILASKN